MALNIKSKETDRLARSLSRLTGETITEAVTVALRQRLERERRKGRLTRLAPLRGELREIRARARLIPRKTDLPVDELLGYGEDGLWK